MNIVTVLLALTGAIGLGYGLSVVIKQRIEIYRRGEIHLYEGRPAMAIGGGLSIAGLGALVLGGFGFTPLAMAFGILCSILYFVLRHMADRIEDSSESLALPSQKKKR